MCCGVGMGNIAGPYGTFTRFIHIREGKGKRHPGGEAAGSGRFYAFLGNMFFYLMLAYSGDRSIRETEGSPVIQFVERGSIPFLIEFSISNKGWNKDHDLGIIGILSGIQSLIRVTFIRAPVPVFHLVQIGRSTFIGHTKRITNRCTQQTPLEFFEHQSYIEKPGQIILVISCKAAVNL
jgi:hypothetical protein